MVPFMFPCLENHLPLVNTDNRNKAKWMNSTLVSGRQSALIQLCTFYLSFHLHFIIIHTLRNVNKLGQFWQMWYYQKAMEQGINFKKKKVAWFFCHPPQDVTRESVDIFPLPFSPPLSLPPPHFSSRLACVCGGFTIEKYFYYIAILELRLLSIIKFRTS